jgi:two-component system KDP operon response regulator KdpE
MKSAQSGEGGTVLTVERPSAIRVLIVDDEQRLVRFLRSELSCAGHKTLVANDGVSALQVLQSERVDLVILDIMLPDMDGFETCRQIRQFSKVPIIMLSAKGDPRNKVLGLELGADDYLTKPFDTEELLARISAVLRRARMPDDPQGQGSFELGEFVCDDLRVDYAARTVTLRGEEVRISPTEYRLLFELTRNAGRALPHEYLLTSVWGPEYRDEDEYLWVYIGYLRQKLEDNPKQPKLILTVPGFGYRFKRAG